MPEPIRLALVWHMHQPSYRDAESGDVLLPWARLHATKDYRDMVYVLRRYPRVQVTFNLTPSLLDQLDDIATGKTSDRYLEVARCPAELLTEDDRRFLLAHFFDVNLGRMLEPREEYRALYLRAQEAAAARPGPPLSYQELRDLQVWFHLAWADPLYHVDEPLRSLMRKGKGFTEEEKHALLDWGIACAGTVTEEYRRAAATGQIEVTTSAYHHPILPLLIDSESPRQVSSSIRLPRAVFCHPDDAAEQVRRARASHERRFGSPPRGTWPPEGAVSDAALSLLAAARFEWTASDETVLAAALEHRDGGLERWPEALYRSYRVDTAEGPIAMVFRDRKLSDLIGFTYSHWDPEHAAEDFLRRVRGIRDFMPAGESPLVTVILDGENCWESYPEDGHTFLSALYGKLERERDIEAVTVSEALDRVPPGERLTHVPTGSWIRADLGIWVGHSDKNRAWEELSHARETVARVGESAGSGERVAAALDEIYSAEASDWFWWYGDDHPSANRADFDRLFRSHLIRAYRHLGVTVPASLEASLREDAAESGGGPTPFDALGSARIPHVRPVLDGRETDFFEWRHAAMYQAAGATGSMHRATAAMKSIRFGTDGKNMFLRVDMDGLASSAANVSIAILFQGPPERTARIALGAASRGEPVWSGGSGVEVESGVGGYAVEQIAEIRIPLQRCGDEPGRGIRFRVALERADAAEEIAPPDGWLHLTLPEVDLALALWSAL